MKAEFTLPERIVGWTMHTSTPGEDLAVRSAGLLSPSDPEVVAVLERLQSVVFSRIPGFPLPWQVDHFLIFVRQDLSAVAYVNGVGMKVKTRTTRGVVAGQPVMLSDISSVEEVELNIDVPDDAAVIVMRSFGWKRSVYFDFGPLTVEKRPRIGVLSDVLAMQMTLLWGLDISPQVPPRTRVDDMADGFQKLRGLLEARCEEERQYQELLEAHPWMLGLGTYTRVRRHEHFDDRNIPDFTATRSSDGCEDIIELKQPFLNCFRLDGEFHSNFNEAWNQAERYVAFTRTERDYLLRQRNLKFESPRCLLLVGSGWGEKEARPLRVKEIGNLNIKIITYDQLVAQATQVLSMVRTALLPE